MSAPELPPPFSQWRAEELRTDAACAAADLGSILEDLRLVARRCALYEAATFDDDVQAALWEAIVVAYGRSFTAGRDSLGRPGRRRRLTEADLSLLDATDRALHDAVRTERNRHVGHRDDRHGEVNGVFRLTGQADAAGITAVGMTTWRRRGPANYEVSDVRGLAERLIEHLEPTYETELHALKAHH